jgi:ArsR family transcriptional regulator
MDDSITTDSSATAADSCCGGTTQWIERAEADALAGRLGAVADPVRLGVLSIIANSPSGEVCACDFVEPLGKSQPTVSHHLKVLTEAGLIEGDKRGRWIWYRLGDDAVGSLAKALGGVVSSSGTPN